MIFFGTYVIRKRFFWIFAAKFNSGKIYSHKKSGGMKKFLNLLIYSFEF